MHDQSQIWIKRCTCAWQMNTNTHSDFVKEVGAPFRTFFCRKTVPHGHQNSALFARASHSIKKWVCTLDCLSNFNPLSTEIWTYFIPLIPENMEKFGLEKTPFFLKKWRFQVVFFAIINRVITILSIYAIEYICNWQEVI